MTVTGISATRWQGDMDWDKAVSADAQFAYIRASICGAEDVQFQRNADLCPVPKGFYHFLSEFTCWEVQAELFCELIAGKDWELRPVVDCENHTDPSQILLFCQYIEDELGVRPMIYTGAWWWNDNVGDDPLFAAYDLWIALYNNCTGDPLQIEPCPPWTAWKYWQCSAIGNGRGAEFGAQSDDICIELFNGNAADFVAHQYQIESEREGQTLAQRVERLESENASLRADVIRAFNMAMSIVAGE